MTEIERKPLCWIIKIWTTNMTKQFKHPKRFDSFDEASQFKQTLDRSLQEDNVLVLLDSEKHLDLSINVNQIVTMKVAAVYDQGEEDDRDDRLPAQHNRGGWIGR